MAESTFLAIQLLSALLIHGSTLLISAMFGAAALVVYATLRTLTKWSSRPPPLCSWPFGPNLPPSTPSSETDALRTLHLLGTKIMMTVAVCASVFLLTGGEHLVEFWTRGRVTYDGSLMFAFCVLACSQSHSFCTSVLMSASNRQNPLLWYSAFPRSPASPAATCWPIGTA